MPLLLSEAMVKNYEQRNSKPRMLFGDAKHNFNAKEKPINRSDVTASARSVTAKGLRCQRFRLILFLLCSLQRNIRTDRQTVGCCMRSIAELAKPFPGAKIKVIAEAVARRIYLLVAAIPAAGGTRCSSTLYSTEHALP